jgi:hypothetical protein
MSAKKLTHPLTRAVYERQDDGLVRVEDVDGVVGVFDPEGRWQSGALRFADPHLCDFVGGRRPGQEQ